MALALPFFAVTLFVSAFLLFLVQPIIGKLILPKLGGTPQVWNTCMVFFQAALLAGYFYTHAVSTYLSIRRQIALHCALLVVPFLFLLPNGPFNVISWVPPAGGNPVFATLVLLAFIVGVPFIVVATSAPLLQKWFAYTGHPAARDPYFLYGASNLGSMLSLVLYPLFFEPVFRLQAPVDAGAITFDIMSQTWIWTVGYAVLVVLVVGCALLALKGLPTSGLEKVSEHKPASAAAVRDNPVGAEIATMPDPSTNPAVPPADVDQPAAEPSTAVTAAPPAPAAPAAAPVAAPMPAAASAKPGPGTAIRPGSKQGKKKDKHKHRHQNQPQQSQAIKAPDRHDAVQPAAALSAPAPSVAGAPPVTGRHEPRGDDLTNARRFRWVLLAAVPSSFMLAVTTHISTDISAIPLFWVIPLALYLLTFILVFAKWPVVWTGQPHTFMLYVQPVALAAVVFISAPLAVAVQDVKLPTAINLLAFFITTLACHGELAKDRPSTKHLTEFYLWMSVGGMIGGMFNGLLAPVIFPGVWEFPIAIVIAAAIRPVLMSPYSVDVLVANLMGDTPKPEAHRGKKLHHRPAHHVAEPSETLSLTLDVVLAMVVGGLTLALVAMAFRGNVPLTAAYAVPLAIAAMFFARPYRLALALLFFILATSARDRDENTRTLATERSYFGVLKIQQSVAYTWTKDDKRIGLVYNSMTHGTTHHGQNFVSPKRSDNLIDNSRLATTYYHRQGPAGIAMSRWDWLDPKAQYYFRVDEQTDAQREAVRKAAKEEPPRHIKPEGIIPYPSDFRMPANILGALAGSTSLPMGGITAAWSEPPIAVIGLGTGTMASYARPFQHMHFYEIDDRVRRYSLGKEPYFTYLKDAQDRGAAIHVLMGDARLRMALPWYPEEPQFKGKQPWETAEKDRMEFAGGPKHYYNLIVVDAFSSDAIPMHLLTREAVEMYMSRLAPGRPIFEQDANGKTVLAKDGTPKVIGYAPGGLLCIHISNRHLDLEKVVADIIADATVDSIDDQTGAWKKQKGLEGRRGRDNVELKHLQTPGSKRQFLGHSTSEWVIVARDKRDLDPFLLPPPRYAEFQSEMGGNARGGDYWTRTAPTGRFIWTDDYSNLYGVLRLR